MGTLFTNLNNGWSVYQPLQFHGVSTYRYTRGVLEQKITFLRCFRSPRLLDGFDYDASPKSYLHNRSYNYFSIIKDLLKKTVFPRFLLSKLLKGAINLSFVHYPSILTSHFPASLRRPYSLSMTRHPIRPTMPLLRHRINLPSHTSRIRQNT